MGFLRCNLSARSAAWPGCDNRPAHRVQTRFSRISRDCRRVVISIFPPVLGRVVHQNRLLRLAREGGQSAVYQLQDLEPQRRYATLAAILLEASATLTDQILKLHDRLIGTFFSKARHKHERAFMAAGRALNEKVRLYAKVGAALIAAKDSREDPFRGPLIFRAITYGSGRMFCPGIPRGGLASH